MILSLRGAYRKPHGVEVAGTELAFYTDDVQAAYDRALTAGARALTPPRTMDWGQTVAYVEDPAGTIIGFISRHSESDSVPDA